MWISYLAQPKYLNQVSESYLTKVCSFQKTLYSRNLPFKGFFKSSQMLQQNSEYMNNDPWTRCTCCMRKELWNPFRPCLPREGGRGRFWVWLVDNHMKLTLLLTLQIRGMVLSASLTFRIPNKYIVLKHMIHPNTMISLNIGADRRINLENRPTFALGRHNCEKKTGKHFLILDGFHFCEYKRSLLMTWEMA